MQFVCLDGSVVNIEVKPSKFPPRDISGPQSAARERIKQEFGDQIVLEEFTIPKSQLRIDFFLPRINIAVEVHGRQHYEFVKHFHTNKRGFAKSKQNDADKKHWCDLNDIELVIWDD